MTTLAHAAKSCVTNASHQPPTNINSLLILLTLASFLPQLLLVRARGNSDGISLTYVLINLIVATEQLGLYIQLIAFSYHGTFPGMINNPPKLADWLNLAQFAIVWLGHFTL
jgi:uncharacterized protein with PQ loop repeat